MKKILTISCSLLAMCVVTPAYAEQAGGAGAPSQSAGTDNNLGDIIVTAQRRSELSRDVPLSIAVFSEQQLKAANVSDTRDLAVITPGLQIDRVGNFTLPAIRGITTTITSPGTDPNVAIYLDNVYQPSITSNTFDLPDVQGIEVLKGPQGTLFGRNATGGAIRVTTKAPSYTPNGSLFASYGNFNDVVVKGFASTPLVADKVAVSLAGFYHRDDTYYHNLRTTGPKLEGDEAYLVRGKLRLNPTEDFEATLTGSYSKRRESLAIYGNPLNGNTVGRLLDANAIIPTKPYDVAVSDATEPQTVTGYSLSLNLKWNVAGGSLTSITAYNDYKLRNVLDPDLSYAPNGLGVNYFANTIDRYFSQEVTFASESHGPLNYVFGVYYTKGKSGWNPLGVRTPAVALSIFGFQRTESIAGFGEAYWDLTDKFSLIAGLRYTHETRRHNSTAVFGVVNAAQPASIPLIGKKSWNNASPRLSLRYKLTPESNVYFTYSQGFKSGVFNTTALGSPDLANPEKLHAYELGYKGRLSNIFTLNVAGFYYEYKDMQANAYKSVNNVPLSILQNVAGARVYGIDADMTARFNSSFDVRAAVSVLDAKYRDFKTANVVVPCSSTASPCATGGIPTLTGNRSIAVDATDNKMIRAPKVSGSISANGHFDVASGRLDLSTTLFYSSRIYYEFSNRVSQSPYATLDARASWTPEGLPVTFSIYGRNLTDKAFISGTNLNEISDAVAWAPPRTYGASVEFKF